MWRPGREDFIEAAAAVLGVEPAAIARLPGLGLAESALAAPFAGFGGVERYPTLEQKAAVLIERLARNHPLPDGNKRVAFLLMVDFLEANGRAWGHDLPDVDEPIVRRVAAGEGTLDEIVEWISSRSIAR